MKWPELPLRVLRVTISSKRWYPEVFLLFFSLRGGGGETGVPISHIPEFLGPMSHIPDCFAPHYPISQISQSISVSQVLQDANVYAHTVTKT